MGDLKILIRDQAGNQISTTQAVDLDEAIALVQVWTMIPGLSVEVVHSTVGDLRSLELNDQMTKEG